MTEPLDVIEHRRMPISGSEIYVYASAPGQKVRWRYVPSSENETETPLRDAPENLFGGLNGSYSRGFILVYGGARKDDVIVYFSGRGGRDQTKVTAQSLAGGIWVAEAAAPFDTVEKVVCLDKEVIVQCPLHDGRGRMPLIERLGLRGRITHDRGILMIPDDDQ